METEGLVQGSVVDENREQRKDVEEVSLGKVSKGLNVPRFHYTYL
jgi:hypothetical protein